MDYYNRSFEVIARSVEEEADYMLRSIRRKCLNDFVNRMNERQRDWESTYYKLLKESQGDDKPVPNPPNIELTKKEFTISLEPEPVIDLKLPPEPQPPTEPISQSEPEPLPKPPTPPAQGEQDKINIRDSRFSNEQAIQEFIRIQKFLDETRQTVEDIVTNPANRAFKNELNIFIRTQINSISNSDTKHLETKIRNLSNLFQGGKIRFQDKLVDATKHPQGPLFAMDLTAQTFVTVGTKLVNSVPAIAKSMASVINGIIRSNLPIFKDLIIGHIQERSPYLVPMLPQLDDFAGHEINHKIACGYNYDHKTQVLEPEENYLIRMRSLTIIYASILMQGHMNNAWSWLASFLSLKAQPVITATILQAFLQEASKQMSLIYGRQYKKMLTLIKNQYLEQVEKVTQTLDRQSLMRLKNQLGVS